MQRKAIIDRTSRGMHPSRRPDILAKHIKSKFSLLISNQWDKHARENGQHECNLSKDGEYEFLSDETCFPTLHKKCRRGRRFLLSVTVSMAWLMPFSAIAESARDHGRRLATIQLSIHTVAFCMLKYEAWSNEQAESYVQSAYISLDGGDLDAIRLFQARKPELGSPSFWQRVVNKTLQNYGGCHSFLEQTGKAEFLMLMNQGEKYSDRPF